MKKNKKGFTLIEIIVVLVIMGILLAIAVPSILGYVRKADDAKFLNHSSKIYTDVQTFSVEKFALGVATTGDGVNVGSINQELCEKYDIKNGVPSDTEYVELGGKKYGLKCLYVFYDGIQDKEFKIDKNLSRHSVTKVGIQYMTSGGSDSIFVVYLPNKDAKVFHGFKEVSTPGSDYKLF